MPSEEGLLLWKAQVEGRGNRVFQLEGFYVRGQVGILLKTVGFSPRFEQFLAAGPSFWVYSTLPTHCMEKSVKVRLRLNGLSSRDRN